MKRSDLFWIRRLQEYLSQRLLRPSFEARVTRELAQFACPVFGVRVFSYFSSLGPLGFTCNERPLVQTTDIENGELKCDTTS